jgi:hypothetical protein
MGGRVAGTGRGSRRRGTGATSESVLSAACGAPLGVVVNLTLVAARKASVRFATCTVVNLTLGPAAWLDRDIRHRRGGNRALAIQSASIGRFPPGSRRLAA